MRVSDIIVIFSVVYFIDNDSEDEDTSITKPEKKTTESGEVAEDQEDSSMEAEDEDEDGAGEDNADDSQEVEGVDSSSERDGRQTLAASMSSRSESKSYSSVTHKCEVRGLCSCS